MTYDEAKNLLKSLTDKRKLYRVKERMLAEAINESPTISAVRYDGIHVDGGENTPVQQRYIERVERLENERDKAFTEMCDIEDYISRNLSLLSPIEQTIIIERYMNGKSWKKLEREYCYSQQNLYVIHQKAIKNFSKTKSLE